MTTTWLELSYLRYDTPTTTNSHGLFVNVALSCRTSTNNNTTSAASRRFPYIAAVPTISISTWAAALKGNARQQSIRRGPSDVGGGTRYVGTYVPLYHQDFPLHRLDLEGRWILEETRRRTRHGNTSNVKDFTNTDTSSLLLDKPAKN